MKKILLITSRNIISTCGELRLIKNRAKVLNEEYGFVTDFMVYRLRKKDENEDVGGKLKLYRDPVDRKRLIYTTQKLVISKKYSCIILSGSTVYFLIPVIKAINSDCKIILDVHGSIEELVEFRNTNIKEKLFFALFYKYIKYVEKKYAPLADGILAVSHPLIESYQSLVKQRELKSFIVPCAITGNLSYEEYLKNRKEIRNKYFLTDSDKVFIYSGGSSPWQCVDETVELFHKIRKKLGDRCKLLLFSGDKILLNRYGDENSIITDCLPPNKVIETLCAGDFGIMLRSDSVTNNVAFPNKFLEYIVSGLRVISTPYVHDVREYIREYNMGLIIELPVKADDITRICEAALQGYNMEEHFDRRKRLIKKCSFRKTLRPFVEFIEESK